MDQTLDPTVISTLPLNQRMARYTLAISLILLPYFPGASALGLLLLYFHQHRNKLHLDCRNTAINLTTEKWVIFGLSALIFLSGALHFTLPALLGSFNFFPYLLLLWILFTLPTLFLQQKTLTNLLVISMLPFLILTLYGNFYPIHLTLIPGISTLDFHAPMQSLFGNMDAFGIYTSTIILLSFNLLRYSKTTRYQQIGLLLTMLVGAACIYILHSRNATTSLGIALIVQLFFELKSRTLPLRNKLFTIGMIAFTVVAAGVALTSRFSSAISSMVSHVHRQSSAPAVVISSENQQRKNTVLKQLQHQATLISQKNHTTQAAALQHLAQLNGFSSWQAITDINPNRPQPGNYIRLFIWQYALTHALQHPFIGWGWQSFSRHYLASDTFKRGQFIAHKIYHAPFNNHIHHPHQLYLTWLFEGGVFVFLGYGLLLYTILRRGWLGTQRLIYFTPMCVLLISGFFDNLFYSPRINLLFVLLAVWNYGGLYKNNLNQSQPES